jgi:hypothetical protein
MIECIYEEIRLSKPLSYINGGEGFPVLPSPPLHIGDEMSGGNVRFYEHKNQNFPDFFDENVVLNY